jgi:hypothetical protein
MKRPKLHRRSGSILVLSLIMMIGMMGIIALAVDIGYLKLAGTELQRSADSAAIAAATRLMEEQRLPGQPTPSFSASRAVASQFAGLNKVACAVPGLTDTDVTIGQVSYPFGLSSQPVTGNCGAANGVKVRIRRTTDQNGEVSLFYARVFGISSEGVQGEATAAFVSSAKGFRPPTPSSNIMLLPFALDKQTWDALMAGGGCDHWAYDPVTRHVGPGSDSIREVNLYPQGTGSPGNRGTVDIGSSNNSTNDIKRQILYGISPADLACMGGKIELGANGTLTLNADTGLSAGFESQLQSIVGQTRIIPIFSQLNGNGNNAMYTIVQFAGIRVLDVNLTGNPNDKHVTVQPAVVKTGGVIPSTTNTSSYVYSPVCLVH